jgi:hypothetical protein
MHMNTSLHRQLLGFWKLHQLDTRFDEEVRSETVLGGMAAFDEKHVVYFSRTNEVAMGFAADYRLEGRRILLQCEAATFPDLEKELLVREIESVTGQELWLTGVEIGTHRQVRLGFRRL